MENGAHQLIFFHLYFHNHAVYVPHPCISKCYVYLLNVTLVDSGYIFTQPYCHRYSLGLRPEHLGYKRSHWWYCKSYKPAHKAISALPLTSLDSLMCLAGTTWCSILPRCWFLYFHLSSAPVTLLMPCCFFFLNHWNKILVKGHHCLREKKCS